MQTQPRTGPILIPPLIPASPICQITFSTTKSRRFQVQSPDLPARLCAAVLIRPSTAMSTHLAPLTAPAEACSAPDTDTQAPLKRRAAPLAAKPKLHAIMWEEEKVVCYQVEYDKKTVARRNG